MSAEGVKLTLVGQSLRQKDGGKNYIIYLYVFFGVTAMILKVSSFFNSRRYLKNARNNFKNRT